MSRLCLLNSVFLLFYGLLGLRLSEGYLLGKRDLALERLGGGTGGGEVGFRGRKLGTEGIKSIAVGGLLSPEILNLGSEIIAAGYRSVELLGGKRGIRLGLCL